MNKTQLRSLCIALFFSPWPSLSLGAAPQGGDKWSDEELERVAAEIQKDVESIRDQRFERPVAVELTDGPAFVRYVEERQARMSTPEQQSAEEDVFKMLGLVPADMDLARVAMDMLEGQVGGFYDPGEDTFYLMEAFTGDMARVILSHELTHALDDQLFDLDGGYEERLGNRDALSAYHAVAEGSGTAIMTLWTMNHIRSLDPGDLEQAQSMGVDALKKAPDVLWKPLFASYTAGQAFLNRGYAVLKETREEATLADATKRAFQAPPRSTEQILHPDKYWRDSERDEPQEVQPALEVPGGWEVLEDSVLGELYLALCTEEPETIDFSDPMQLAFLKFTNPAATGWGGDRGVLYGRGAARLYVLTTAWDTREDAAEFERAMEARLVPWRRKVARLDPQGLGSGVELMVSADEIPKVTLEVWFGCAKPR